MRRLSAAVVCLTALFIMPSPHAGERLVEWPHPNAELYWVGRDPSAEGEVLSFVVRGASNTFALGHPRVQADGVRWQDVVVVGDIPRDRRLRVSRDAPAAFRVVVPGGWETLEFRLAAWSVRVMGDSWAPAPTLEGGAPTPPRFRATPNETKPPAVVPEPPPPLISAIDRETPRSGPTRENGLAVVLGVERYRHASPARWAADDARTAALYFERVLGIPQHRVLLLTDGEVTLAQFRRIFEAGGWLERRVRPDSEVFVFYAGHGAAATAEDAPFLVPADGHPQYLAQTGYSLATLLHAVAGLNERPATVFVDACFAGVTRDGGALEDGTRPMALVASSTRVPGVSLFAASTGRQPAGTLDREGHGLFSYGLFRGLAGDADLDRDARITREELWEFLNAFVPAAAEREDREQHPSGWLSTPEGVVVDWNRNPAAGPAVAAGEMVGSGR